MPLPGQMCGADGTHECLPSWKFNDAVTAELGTGSAPDGDEDAILGMLLLVAATEADGYTWWAEVAQWTYQSCRAFLEHLTVPHASATASNGEPQRILKLGSWRSGVRVPPAASGPRAPTTLPGDASKTFDGTRQDCPSVL